MQSIQELIGQCKILDVMGHRYSPPVRRQIEIVYAFAIAAAESMIDECSKLLAQTERLVQETSLQIAHAHAKLDQLEAKNRDA